MNRGRGRRTIFHTHDYYQAYLKTLDEAYQRFDAVVHAYCLMGNHYHLLIETPRANLSRIMRHINGVYTQRYNRLKKTDGPLFRGRYKAILVDDSAYFLQLSRYIHRNPIETKKPLKANLDDYIWSSYPAYVGKSMAPEWLYRDKTFQMIGTKNRFNGYRQYIERGNSEELLQFYTKGNFASILGDKEFRQYIIEEKIDNNIDKQKVILSYRPDIDEIILAVAKVFAVNCSSITERMTTRSRPNRPRRFAMYCCQYYGDVPQKDIARTFNVKQAGSVANAVFDIKKTN